MRQWIALLLLMGFACETATDSAVSRLGEGCVLDSECNDDLICVHRRCHEACEQSRDCGPDERCVRGDNGSNICQLGDEVGCALNSDCRTGQVCAVDGQCRDECRADADCVKGQLCVAGACADPEELVDGKLPEKLPSESGEGAPCALTSDCNAPLVCIGGLCLFECRTDEECPSGVCQDNHCIPTGPDRRGLRRRPSGVLHHRWPPGRAHLRRR